MNLALIIGAMKSGTTSLFEYLAGHPAIAQCEIKEPNFFSDEDLWGRGIEWYQGLFDWDPEQHRWALEASTSYTKPRTAQTSAERIASFPGEKRLIFIMRDPVERLRSHLAYGKAKGWPSFEGPEDQIPEKALDVSRYARQLRPYRTVFAKERILLLFFEDFVESPEPVIARVCSHLELDPERIDADFTRAYNVTGDKLLRPDWYREIRDNPLVTTLRRLLPGRRWIARSLLKFETPTEVRFGPERRDWIVKQIAPDLRELRSEFDVDISRWGLLV